MISARLSHQSIAMRLIVPRLTGWQLLSLKPLISGQIFQNYWSRRKGWRWEPSHLKWPEALQGSYNVMPRLYAKIQRMHFLNSICRIRLILYMTQRSLTDTRVYAILTEPSILPWLAIANQIYTSQRICLDFRLNLPRIHEGSAWKACLA